MTVAVLTRLEDLTSAVAGVRREVLGGSVDEAFVVRLRRLANELDVVLTRAVTSFADRTSFARWGIPTRGRGWLIGR